MCEEEELQELWEPCEGSWVKRVDFVEPYVLDYDADRVICYAFDQERIKKRNPNPEFLKWYDQIGDNYVIWLPTQEQLQEMILKPKNTFCPDIFTMLKLLNVFAVVNKYDEMNELLLAFVMKEKWNKIWTGKDWVK